MSDAVKGWLFVAVQFGLFAAIALTPAAGDWEFPVQFNLVGWIAFGLAGLALWQLGQARTATPVPKSNAELITAGLYRKVRHPIYGLLIIGFALVAMSSQNWQSVRFWISLVFLLYFKSKFEEKLLIQKYSEYATYRIYTGRFFPKFWAKK